MHSSHLHSLTPPLTPPLTHSLTHYSMHERKLHYLQVECVGSVSGGLRDMAWSPDQELVVFSTGTGSLLLMTHQLDPSGDTEHELVPVTETLMCPSEFGEGELWSSVFYQTI